MALGRYTFSRAPHFIGHSTQRWAIAAVLGLVIVLPAQAQLFYRVTDLGDLPGGGNQSAAFGINDSGQIVGYSVVGPSRHAFLWTGNSGMQDLGDLPGGSSTSTAHDINANGQIVGVSTVATGDRAFLWTSTGGMQDLGDLPGGDNFSEARGINFSGQVVGSSRAATGFRAFLWTSGGGMQNLGDLPGGLDVSAANDINAAGQVVGNSAAADGFRAFRWTSGAGMQGLGVLPGFADSFANGINNNGQVVGYSSASARSRAFLWTSGGGMLDLGDLPGGEDASRATAVNDSGQVVGWSYGSPTAGSRAFIWTSGGGLQDLNNWVMASGFGWTLEVASAINNAGQIVGTGPNPNGDYHGFLLTPVETTVLAFTEFEEPDLGVGAFTPGAADAELGFVTASSPSGGVNPLSGVTVIGGGGTRAFSHRSIDATTTFHDVNLANYDEVVLSLRIQVANTNYEAGDFVRASITNGTETIDVATFEGPLIDDLAGDGFLDYRMAIPGDWTQATLVISSSTDSSQGSERFDFDSIEFRGIFVIPEPGTWGLAIAGLVIAAARARKSRFRRRLKCDDPAL